MSKQLKAPETTEFEQQQYQEFKNFNTIDVPSRTGDYQRANLFEGFDMVDAVKRLHEAFDLPAKQEFYLVVFRSQRKDGLTEADINLLTVQDHKAHEEAHNRKDANGNQALLHYFKGLPDADNFCISWCIWADEATAKLASGRGSQDKESSSPHHDGAKRLAWQMYQKFGIQTYRLVLAGEELDIESVQDSWTPQMAAMEQENEPEDIDDVPLEQAVEPIGV